MHKVSTFYFSEGVKSHPESTAILWWAFFMKRPHFAPRYIYAFLHCYSVYGLATQNTSCLSCSVNRDLTLNITSRGCTELQSCRSQSARLNHSWATTRWRIKSLIAVFFLNMPFIRCTAWMMCVACCLSSTRRSQISSIVCGCLSFCMLGNTI